jgi:hypothetical protein
MDSEMELKLSLRALPGLLLEQSQLADDGFGYRVQFWRKNVSMSVPKTAGFSKKSL